MRTVIASYDGMVGCPVYDREKLVIRAVFSKIEICFECFKYRGIVSPNKHMNDHDYDYGPERCSDCYYDNVKYVSLYLIMA